MYTKIYIHWSPSGQIRFETHIVTQPAAGQKRPKSHFCKVDSHSFSLKCTCFAFIKMWSPHIWSLAPSLCPHTLSCRGGTGPCPCSVQTPRGSNSQTRPWCFGLSGKTRINSYYVTCTTSNSYFTFKLIVHILFVLHVSFVFSFTTVFPESPKQVGLSGVGPRSSCPPALH